MTLAIVLFLVLAAEFINGWTDAPNAIATVISTRALPVFWAIVMASTLNIAGAFMGLAVATTIGQDIVDANAIDLLTLGAAMVAIILWGIFSWYTGLPISKSHALVAGLSGAALSEAGPSVLLWEGWSKILLGLVLSVTLGAFISAAIAMAIRLFFANAPLVSCQKAFARAQLFSSALMAFSHGSNDGQKFMGVFSLALLLAGQIESFVVPGWVIMLCALVMGLGTSLGGMRIIKTMGFKIVPLETYQGFSAETGAASTIILASSLGVPLSTTHTIGMAIVGVGYARRRRSIRWNVLRHIIQAWLLTFPVCGLLAYLLVKLIHLIN